MLRVWDESWKQRIPWSEASRVKMYVARAYKMMAADTETPSISYIIQRGVYGCLLPYTPLCCPIPIKNK
jgi:hypothetical protein